MTIKADSVGATTSPRELIWQDRDSLLYALAVGAGVDDLSFATENSHGLDQQVLPTFSVVVCSGVPAIRAIGKVNWGTLLHGAQEVRSHRPLPAAGSLSVVAQVLGLEDKGEGGNAVVHLGARGSDPDSGELVTETVTTLVLRGQGGFGGSPDALRPTVILPDAEPDQRLRFEIRPDLALLYRLTGDRNPLHSDPWFATEKAGFPRPILHGLCTYGIVGRQLVSGVCEGDAERLRAVSARFSAPVFPGDILSTSVWLDDEGVVLFRTEAQSEPDGPARVVLDQGRAETR